MMQGKLFPDDKGLTIAKTTAHRVVFLVMDQPATVSEVSEYVPRGRKHPVYRTIAHFQGQSCAYRAYIHRHCFHFAFARAPSVYTTSPTTNVFFPFCAISLMVSRSSRCWRTPSFSRMSVEALARARAAATVVRAFSSSVSGFCFSR